MSRRISISRRELVDAVSGLGQGVFFLHDGRTNNLLTAIQAHRSNADGTYPAPEANTVIDRFNALSTTAKQNMLNFLRSL